MRIPSLIFCILFFLAGSVVKAQLPYGKLTHITSEANYTTPPSSTEIVEKRELHQRVFKTADGKLIYQQSKAPLCYKDFHGKWMPVEIKATTNQHGFIADKQNNPVSLAYDGTVEIANNEGSLFSVTTLDVFGVTIKDDPIKNTQVHPSLITGKNQYFNYLTEEVLQRSEFKHNGLKLDYVFQNPVATNGGIITQQLNCNPDWKITK